MTLKTPITGLFWSHWSHIAPPGNHWSPLEYTGIAWQLQVTNSPRLSHLAPHGANLAEKALVQTNSEFSFSNCV